jgi:hypothetical protein
MTIDDKGFEKALHSRRFLGLINKHGARQLLGFATFVKSEIRRRLQSGIAGPPLGVQQYIKGNGKLLVHTHGFMNSAGFRYNKIGRGAIGVEVGFITGNAPSGIGYSQLAAIFENGREWIPSPAERMAVAIKAKMAGAPPPDGNTKSVWTIPKRPFLTKILQDPVVLKKFEIAGERTLERALKEFMGGK